MHQDVLALTFSGLLADIGRSVREGFFMFWDTLWALVLGFGLSGAVQAFVSRRSMQSRLGDHRPASVGRAAVYGMVSSSCSYAASAMARSLVARGADYLAAMVFMFASTNLVIELGVVLAALIGWQFLAAEFVGGVVMIALLVAVGSLWLRGRVVVGARTKGWSEAPAGTAHTGDSPAERHPWQRRIRTAAGWSDAAGYTMSDLAMLRREMVLGFAVAGFASVLVPARVWADVFVSGHGLWTVLENALVGPFVALVSCVCSVGNVPLAATLWHGGAAFGGVVAFVFADLIALPLLFVYRKQYGAAMALRMLGLFWLVMSAAGVVTQYLFQAVGWIPSDRGGVVAADSVGWSWTSGADAIAIVVFGVMYWLHRNRARFGAGEGYARDPVCGMQMEEAHAPARTVHGGRSLAFCSDRCRDAFVADPARY